MAELTWCVFDVAHSTAWVEFKERPDGDFDMLMMGRTVVRDRYGLVVSEKTSCNGVGWTPACALGIKRKSLFKRLWSAIRG